MKNDASYLDFLTDKPVTEDDTDSDAVLRSGLGLSFLAGDSRNHGIRMEVSGTAMKISAKNSNSTSEGMAAEIKTSLELAISGFSFGGHMRMIKNGFYDQGDFIQKNFIQVPTTPDFRPSYGFFIALSSDKGHSFGLSGYYFSEMGERQLEGITGDAESKTMLVNINYAYLF